MTSSCLRLLQMELFKHWTLTLRELMTFFVQSLAVPGQLLHPTALRSLSPTVVHLVRLRLLSYQWPLPLFSSLLCWSDTAVAGKGFPSSTSGTKKSFNKPGLNRCHTSQLSQLALVLSTYPLGVAEHLSVRIRTRHHLLLLVIILVSLQVTWRGQWRHCTNSTAAMGTGIIDV